MKFLFLAVLFSVSSVLAMESQKETGKHSNKLSYFDKQLLTQQAAACALINTKQRLKTISFLGCNKGNYNYEYKCGVDHCNDTHYTVEGVSDETHEACQKLLEKFAQSIKDNNNTNDKNGSLGDSL